MKSSEIKNPIELKEYSRPSINIVLLDELLSDTVTVSDPDINNSTNESNGSSAPRRSNHIFDDL